MTKRLLILLITTITTLFAPQLLQQAEARIEINEIASTAEQSLNATRIEQKGNTIIIYNATGSTARIYNLIGVEVMSVRIDSPEKRIDLSHQKRGIYPVKVAGISKKVNISGR